MPESPRNNFAGQVSTRLGRVSLNPRGEYAGGETYDRLDIVQYNGSGWICLKDGTSGATPVEGETWMRFADNGGAATVEAAQEYANQAKASQDAAQQSASEAEQSASEAETSRQAAEAAAGTAAGAVTEQLQGYVDDANTAKTDAQTAQKAAETARDEAKGHSTTAGEKATEASQSADAAQQSATNAAQSAQEAAEQAAADVSDKLAGYVEAAETAKGDAETAATGAQTAQTAAVDAADRAEQAATKAEQIVGGDFATHAELNTGLAKKADLVDGKVDPNQLPEMDYDPAGSAQAVQTTLEAALESKADLENGKVKASQLPEMDYVPTSDKGKNGGVATLDSTGKVTGTQLPENLVVSEDAELPPVELDLNADTLGGHSPNYFQTALTGTQGQVVGFDTAGKAAAAEVGGTNLFVLSALSVGYISNGTLNGGNGAAQERTTDFIPVKPGETFTAQFWGTPIQNDSWTYWMMPSFYSKEKAFVKSGSNIGGKDFSSWTYMHASGSFAVPDGAEYMRLSARMYSDGKVKLERGTVATDWSPAPEDLADKSYVDSAIQTAIQATWEATY